MSEFASIVKLKLKYLAVKIQNFGFKHYCGICNSRLRAFKRHHPKALRAPAMCPVCLSLERHRFAWRYMKEHTDILEPKGRNFLHFAPEYALLSKLIELPGINYITADLDSDLAMVQLDICDIPFEDEEFQIIFCNHVLEHIPDDRLAMRELLRILEPGGQALISVPLRGEETVEDPSITDPEERTRLFGQPDHVRYYGMDIVDRLTSAGFQVKIVRADSIMDEPTTQRMRIEPHDTLFHCFRPKEMEQAN